MHEMHGALRFKLRREFAFFQFLKNYLKNRKNSLRKKWVAAPYLELSWSFKNALFLKR
jgi:hypothetical protein